VPTPDVTVRPADDGDAAGLAELHTRNRDYFRTGEPLRPPEYYTESGQRRVIAEAQAARVAGTGVLFVVVAQGRVIGRAALTSVVRGAFQSGSIGYLVDEAHTGVGVATTAVRHLVAHAFGHERLHRLEAGTLTTNLASQRVLTRCGFERYGTAPGYLRIDGRWQTHHLFQLLNADYPEEP